MSSKQDRIAEAMKERIAQLENELHSCNHHLNEVMSQKENLDGEIDALRGEAHDVVSQWAEKAGELQTSLDDMSSEYKTLQKELLASQQRFEYLQCTSQKNEATHLVQSEELHRSKKLCEELTKRVELAESEWCAATQRILKYENLVNKMDLEIKQNLEDIRSLTLDKGRLMDALADWDDEKRRSETISAEYATLLRNLEDELVFKEKEKRQIMSYFSRQSALVDEEYNDRYLIFLSFKEKLHSLMFNLLREFTVRASEKDVNTKEMEMKNAASSKECMDLMGQLSSLRAQHASMNNDFEGKITELQQQISLLEQDIAELQDSQLSQSQVIKLLRDGLEISTARIQSLELTNEGLDAEFKTVKGCYSSLLVEHNDYKESAEKLQQELTDRVSLLVSEKEQVEKCFNKTLSDSFSENMELCRNVTSLKMENISLRESRERLLLESQWYNPLVSATFDHCSFFLHQHGKIYGLWMNATSESSLLKNHLSEKGVKFDELSHALSLLEAELLRKKDDITSLNDELTQKNDEVHSLTKNFTEITNDNNWLKEQVDGMRKELGELDELLNANLNDMREEDEKHETENGKLLSEKNQLEEKNQKLQTQVDSIEDRYAALEAEYVAVSKTLSITEMDLLHAREENILLRDKEKVLVNQRKKIEVMLSRVEEERLDANSQVSVLKEQLRTQDARAQLFSSASRQEVDVLKTKINNYIEKCEEAEEKVLYLSKSLQECEGSLVGSRESYSKAKNALEEVKQRCCKDSDTIKKLLDERDSLVKEREILVGKHNRLYDVLKNVRKENIEVVSEHVQKLSDLCSRQEVELQQLRHQNIIFKKCFVKVAEGSRGPVERPVFVERLNITEGPLRHPKKRAALSAEAKRSQ